MTRTNLFVTSVCVLAVFCGCTAKLGGRTGFLSDYSRLKAQSDVSFRYIAPGNALGRYSDFIIDPVTVHFHTGSTAIKERSKGKLSEQDITDMKNYMHAAIVKEVSFPYRVVYQPGPGVARVRIALTDLKRSKIVQNIVPFAKIAGTGLGGASLEAEVIDSQTGVQIGAVVESQLGSRLSLDGLSKWGDAKAVMDDWANRFRKRLDEAH